MTTFLKIWSVLTLIAILLLDEDNNMFFNLTLGLICLAYIIVFLIKLNKDDEIYLKDKYDIF